MKNVYLKAVVNTRVLTKGAIYRALVNTGVNLVEVTLEGDAKPYIFTKDGNNKNLLMESLFEYPTIEEIIAEIPTHELVTELSGREGVRRHNAYNPDTKYEVKVQGETVENDAGAVILVVID